MRRTLLLAPLLTACATAPTYRIPSRGTSARAPGVAHRGPRGGGPQPTGFDIGVDERGLASYYSDSLAGNTTANGERYDPGALTAAHRTLRFGTRVRVERDDGAGVEVCVNDRGPFVSGRVIDLSRAAADALGMIRAGVVEVTLRVVGHRGGRRCE